MERTVISRTPNPEELRNEVQRLIEAADKTGDSGEQRTLALRALQLAQEAEAAERNNPKNPVLRAN